MWNFCSLVLVLKYLFQKHCSIYFWNGENCVCVCVPVTGLQACASWSGDTSWWRHTCRYFSPYANAHAHRRWVALAHWDSVGTAVISFQWNLMFYSLFFLAQVYLITALFAPFSLSLFLSCSEAFWHIEALHFLHPILSWWPSVITLLLLIAPEYHFALGASINYCGSYICIPYNALSESLNAMELMGYFPPLYFVYIALSLAYVWICLDGNFFGVRTVFMPVSMVPTTANHLLSVENQRELRYTPYT